MKRLSILGSTGSIGKNALDVVARLSDTFAVQYLSAGQNLELLYEQARRFHPRAVAILSEKDVSTFLPKFRELGVEVWVGLEGLLAVSSARDVDIVLNALVGAAGLKPTLQALQPGKRIALANKESLVIGGELVMQKAREVGAEIVPVDSEHSAILQCLVGENPATIRQLVLTASGGPFRELDVEHFAQVTVEQALDHPNWDMGPKITVDSATLMNKGLEVIEARWLFDIEPARIKVVIHPQSVVHSFVEFEDGSVKAQLGMPDMRIPIQYALTFPERCPADFPRLDFGALRALTFEPPDLEKFACLRLSFQALESGGSAPAILNAANEEAVRLFLERKIGFEKIPQLVEDALARIEHNSFASADELLEYDRRAREFVHNRLSL